MKLISLNIQGGSQGKAFFDYIKKQKKTADIICFQEVFKSKLSDKVMQGHDLNIHEKLENLLKNFEGRFFPAYNKMGTFLKLKGKVEFGYSIYVKRGFVIEDYFCQHIIGSLKNEINFQEEKESNGVQCAKIQDGQKTFWVVNVHGVAHPGDKLDTPKRVLQSKKIVAILKKLKGPKILCGDFNLLPNTKSILLIEQAGMKNLIKTYKIKNTRNSISWKKYNNKQYFADFTFVSQKIQVKSFKVPYNLVSDHLPMVLEFEV